MFQMRRAGAKAYNPTCQPVLPLVARGGGMRSTYSVARVLTLALALFSFFPLTGVAQDADQPTTCAGALVLCRRVSDARARGSGGNGSFRHALRSRRPPADDPRARGGPVRRRQRARRGRVHHHRIAGSSAAPHGHGTSPAHGFGCQRSGERHSLPDRYAVGLSLDRWPWRIPDRAPERTRRA